MDNYPIYSELKTLSEKSRTEEGPDPDELLNQIEANQMLSTLQALHGDLKHSHSEVLTTFSDLSNKSTRLLQFDGTLLAILVATASVVNVDDFINILTVLGISAVILSTIILVHSSRTSTVTVGTGESEFRIATGVHKESRPMNEKTYLMMICAEYTKWIDDAAKSNRIRGAELRLSEYLTVLGIGLLIAGTFFALQ